MNRENSGLLLNPTTKAQLATQPTNYPHNLQLVHFGIYAIEVDWIGEEHWLEADIISENLLLLLLTHAVEVEVFLNGEK